MSPSASNLKAKDASTKNRILITTIGFLTLEVIVPEFSKYSGEDGKITLEHVGQFILQCGETSANEVLKLRMFHLSLSDTTFTWFTSLAPNYIFTWA
jgi:hypothetical protein